MKKLLIIFLAFFVIHSTSFAAATVPNTSVWVTPADAKVGTTITLNALVYNDQNQDVTVTVLFKTPTVSIGTVSQSIAAGSAKTVTEAWTMPDVSTTVTATVTAAVTKQKQSVSSLIGVVGTVSVGASTTSLAIPGSSAVSAWFRSVFSSVESFRTKEASYYAALRDETKKALGITPSQHGAATVGEYGLPVIKADNPVQYFTLIYATALAAFFGSQVIFYVSVVLIILLILRFIVNMFV